MMTGPEQRTATLSGPVTGGRGWAFGSPADVAEYGYVIEEFLLDGVAQSYEPVPGTTVGRDGRWTVQRGQRAQYRTRMYVARPADPARFNGVVIAFWLNVTAGFDLGTPSEHEMRAGYAWVGITAQAVAIDGQPSLAPGFPATPGLPRIDQERYGTLRHPGDAYSFDIFTQAARAVGPGRPTDGIDPLGGLTPRLVIACGASQSSARLGAYLNMADDTERCFDGYLLLTHWGLCVYPPDQPMMVTFRPLGDGLYGGSSAINDRGRVPVLVLNSESEALHNVPVRQPDSPTFRFWEIAGAGHIGEVPDMTPLLVREGMPVFPPARDANTVDWRWVRSAALEHLVRWVGRRRAAALVPADRRLPRRRDPPGRDGQRDRRHPHTRTRGAGRGVCGNQAGQPPRRAHRAGRPVPGGTARVALPGRGRLPARLGRRRRPRARGGPGPGHRA